MTPRGLTKEQIEAHISRGEKRYSGILKPHIRMIVIMWAKGFSHQQIADQIAHVARGERLQFQYGLIYYVLTCCGLYRDDAATEQTYSRYNRNSSFEPLRELLPGNVATAQAQWDRRRQAQRMHAVGLTYRQIGDRMNVSYERVRQMTRQADRETRSPIEKYLTVPPDKDLAKSKLVKTALRKLSLSSDRDWLILAA